MHLILELRSEKKIVLPVHYNHILQGFIYNTINSELADFLHREGYGEKRKFKLFAFREYLAIFKLIKNLTKSYIIRKYHFKYLHHIFLFANLLQMVYFRKKSGLEIMT
jgi:CRISPR/Cas system endoribonuclease Cas6 (RAMP superfamily)